MAGCGKSAPATAADPSASTWLTEPGWSGACFVAPPPEADEKALQDTLNAMALQWRGGRSDGVSFPMALVVQVRDLLRARPEQIAAVAAENQRHCAAVMAGESSTVGWGSWLAALPQQLTAGECTAMLQDDRYEHLDIESSWQLEQPLCAGESLTLTASASDHFRLSADGPWLNADGDDAALPAGAPCQEDGCRYGMLVGRFSPEDGSAPLLFPVGTRASFTAPSSGTLAVSLNDEDFGDNAWQITDGYADKTSVTYIPSR